MKTSTDCGGAWKSFLWALLFTCLCLGIPSVADAQQFFGAKGFQPPQVGSPSVSDAATREQWQGYYSRNSWWQAGRTNPNGGQGTYPNTSYQWPTGGGRSW
jgi:hypothetical protein